MKRVVVVGGGWAGCAAALGAAKQGFAVTLLERTDRLLGTGLVGGIMRNNGRFTAAEELILMGARELIELTDRCSRHRNINFPGHRHASFYDVNRIEQDVQGLLLRWGVELRFQSRAVDLKVTAGTAESVALASGERIGGDVFVDACGSAGPQVNCSRHGYGCAMCIYRCPTFGPRVSIAVKGGAEEVQVLRKDGKPGFISGSCELEPQSLAGWLIKRIRREAVVIIPLPESLWSERMEYAVSNKACRQYIRPEYKKNLILIDNGSVKMMLPGLPLQMLRRIRGLERAVYRDPLGGSSGNSVRLTGSIQADAAMRVMPFKNLLAAGERFGLIIGHTEAIISGTLAGYNAARILQGKAVLELPRDTVCGELLYCARLDARDPESRHEAFNLSGGPFWEHLQRQNLYTTERHRLEKRIKTADLLKLFSPA